MLNPYLAHLIGDYLLQNDWMGDDVIYRLTAAGKDAINEKNPPPKP